MVSCRTARTLPKMPEQIAVNPPAPLQERLDEEKNKGDVAMKIRHETLREIEEAALVAAADVSCQEPLHYELAAAAAKLRRSVYPELGVINLPELEHGIKPACG